jgi:hypothetical protein
MNNALTAEIAVHAARLIAEEGLEYGAAKRRAAREVNVRGGRRPELPSNELVEEELRSYLALFHADTQPGELHELRALALRWMQRVAEFRPHVSGAVWRGTATRRNDVWIGLFCDDPKSAEIWMLNQHVHYELGEVQGFQGQAVPVLSVADRLPGWPQPVLLHFVIHDHDDLRGALKPDTGGRTERGDLAALRHLMDTQAHDGS